MDPYLLPVIGKSEKAAADLQEGCNGYVSAAPNVVVNWAGAADQLSFFIYSDADAALVIQGPDGSFLCNDDAGLNTTDPLVKIANPAPGSYKVFAGTAAKDAPALGFLAITQADLDDARLAELDLTSMLRRRERPRLQALPQLDPQTLLAGRRPIFGSAELQAGFKPVQVFAAGGGDIAAFRMEDKKLACAGFIERGAQLQLHLDGQAAGAPAVLRGAAGQRAGRRDTGWAGALRDERGARQPEPGRRCRCAGCGPVPGLRGRHDAQYRGAGPADHHRRP